MTVSGVLISLCFVILMILGIAVLLISLFKLTKRNAPSQISLPGVKLELKGPAWLVCALIGAIMLASPVITAALQNPENVTIPLPPASVEQVRDVPDPTYEAFRFVQDVSVLDLRATHVAPWYTSIPGWQLIDRKPKTRPAILRNYMVVRKVLATDKIHLTYGTSGTLDIRCLTHDCQFRRAFKNEDDKQTETWEVVADVGSIPVGQEFELAVEATYWNAFSGEKGDDYSTYTHEQTDPERMSVVLFFPEEKPFKDIAVTQYGPTSDTGVPIQGSSVSWPGPKNQTYYWSTVSHQGNEYYKIAWNW